MSLNGGHLRFVYETRHLFFLFDKSYKLIIEEDQKLSIGHYCNPFKSF